MADVLPRDRAPRLAALFCLPFYLLVAISLKTTRRALHQPASLPDRPGIRRTSATAWNRTAGLVGPALLSSLIITVGSVVCLIVLGSFCAYTIARRRRLSTSSTSCSCSGSSCRSSSRSSRCTSRCEPGLVGNYLGMIILNIGLLMPLTVFLYTGFIRALPRDYEEAAQVDGAGILRTYVRVVFPLLRPVTGDGGGPHRARRLERVLHLADLPGRQRRTRRFRSPIYASSARTSTQWNLIFAGVAIAIAPIVRLLPLRAAAADRGSRRDERLRWLAIVLRAASARSIRDGTRAVAELDLEIEDGELMVLVGPSGAARRPRCGWSPASRRSPRARSAIGDRVVNELDPRKRDIAMVFQNYALYPHMSVFDNIAFPLRARGLPEGEVRGRVETTAQMLGLDDHLKRKPSTLSGGQRQRVAMGRAIVREPQVFLMDEPLSNLDAKLRMQMRAEIARLQRELGVTTIYVTHDQVEAMTMGTRIAVMRKGVLQQQGPPQSSTTSPTTCSSRPSSARPG